MSHVEVEVVEARAFASTVADEIVAVIEETLADRDRCFIALSGGETPASVNRLLALAPRVESIDWDRVTLILGDERWVPVNDPQSNAKMVQDTLLSSLSHKPIFIHVNTSLASPELGAKDYESKIKAALGEGGVLDLVLLGMGEDGHIASLFPNCEKVKRGGASVITTKSPNGQQRISLSIDTLFSARKIVFLVKGEGKASMIKQVMHGKSDPQTLPARFYTIAQERVTWILDTSAASQL